MTSPSNKSPGHSGKPVSGPAAAPAGADLSFLRALAGRFIVFEGPDGSGKSTQFRRLSEALKAQKVTTCEVREPGGTPVGERIRDVLLRPFGDQAPSPPPTAPTASTAHRAMFGALDPAPDNSSAGIDADAHGMTVRCEMLLYMASRAELVERIILPALKRRELVLADRFVASTLAYQGSAGGLSASDISAVARVATRNLQPDLVVVFDLDHHAAAKRMGLLLDRMEAKGAAFHSKVREGYLAQAKADPGRYAIVDASQDPDTVWASLVNVLRERV